MSSSSIKLSPLVKSLLWSTHAKSGPIPSPSSSTLISLFDRIRTKGEAGGVGRDTFLTLTSASLLTVNSPNALCGLYDYAATSGSLQDRIGVVGVMRETGLKCISFNGIPRTINGLGALRSHLPQDVVDRLRKYAVREPTPTNIESIETRGRKLWDDIYAPHHLKLLSKLTDSHPDLPVHILNSHYGPLLSDPPESDGLVGRVLTSVVAITCLRAQTGVGPQVTSHVFGLKKALLGKGGDEVQGGEWLCGDDGIKWILDSTDEISEVLSGGVSFADPISRERESKL